MKSLVDFINFLNNQKQYMMDEAIETMVIAGCYIYDVERNYIYNELDKSNKMNELEKMKAD